MRDEHVHAIAALGRNTPEFSRGGEPQDAARGEDGDPQPGPIGQWRAADQIDAVGDALDDATLAEAADASR